MGTAAPRISAFASDSAVKSFPHISSLLVLSGSIVAAATQENDMMEFIDRETAWTRESVPTARAGSASSDMTDA